MKKTLSIILSVALVLALFSSSGVWAVQLDTTTYTEGDYTYSVSNGEATIVAVNTKISGKVIIPSTLGTYPVTNIGKNAFKSCRSITDITIPNGVKIIDEYAFDGCSNIISITIPSSLKTIKNYAFYYCANIEKVYITDLKAWCEIDCYGDYEVNKSPMIFADELYLNGEILSGELVIPEGTTSIASCAFWGCSEITSVSMPNSVTRIGEFAFRKCTSLAEIEASNNITTVGEDAFYNTAWFDNQPNGIVYVGSVAYKYKGTPPSNLTIKNGTKGIADYAFVDYDNITQVSLPPSLENIGVYSFFSCDSITELTIPNSVTKIENHAFYSCNKLVELNAGVGLTNIGYGAFSDCELLQNINLPDKPINIAARAFSNTAWYNSQPEGLVYVGKVLYEQKGLCPYDITVKDGTLAIAESAFSGDIYLEFLTLPSSLVSIGNHAFNGCRKLENLAITKNALQISENAFNYTNIKRIDFGGTKDEWQAMPYSKNESFANAKIICICMGEHSFTNEQDLVCDACNYKKFILGDINHSGTVPDLDDVVALAQIVAGWGEVSHNEFALDVNDDGKKTLDDVVWLAQYVAGWDVILS